VIFFVVAKIDCLLWMMVFLLLCWFLELLVVLPLSLFYIFYFYEYYEQCVTYYRFCRRKNGFVQVPNTSGSIIDLEDTF
jgi:hypothetical protein